MSAKTVTEGILFGILVFCCLVIPLLSLGGAGVVLGFLQNNLIIILAGLVLIVLAIILHFRRER